MLIDFRFKNFRSFKDENVLSLNASSDKTLLAANTAETHYSSVPRLLKVAGIYGANASGKSNVLRALMTLQAIVTHSASFMPNQLLPFQPFRLAKEHTEKPTEFEINFFAEFVRHQYSFSFDANRIVSESLIVYKTNRPRILYSRQYNQKTQSYDYELGSSLSGPKTTWKDSTRPNSLFLSTAVQLNSEQLKPAYDWITKDLIIFPGFTLPTPEHTVKFIRDNGSTNIQQFLASADVSIDNIGLKSFPRKTVSFDFVTGSLTQAEDEQELPTFTHTTEDGATVFDFADESDGTQKLFALAGPIFEILKRGQILVVDELDRSLHVLLVRHLIERFQQIAKKTSHAQLIFTSHDTSLLDSDLLRRDQLWFTEKDTKQASKLFPLTDFTPRKTEALERGYLAGRYGAIPIFDAIQVDG